MRAPTFREAIRLALRDELASDPTVLFFGEDVAAAGGVFQATRGLADDFGADRVFDTPISELALAAAAFGCAVSGYRPVVEVMFGDFATLVTDSLINQAAKYGYWSGGRHNVPITIRTTTGAGMRFGAIHSQNPASLFLAVPGMSIIAPSTADDAYSLLRAAVRHDGPVLFLEHKGLYQRRASSELGSSPAKLGVARVVRAGDDVTVVSVMQGVHLVAEAAESLARQGISCDVIDLRSLRPMDVDTVEKSLLRTRRLLVVDESPGFGSWGAELVAQLSERVAGAAFARLSAAEHPLPFSPPLEDAAIPSVARIAGAVDELSRRY